MEVTPAQQTEATASDTASTTARFQADQDSPSSSTQHLTTKPLRSSARVKAAKEKSKENLRGKGKERDLAHSSSEAPLSDSATQRTTRSGTKTKRIDEDLKDKSNTTEESTASSSKRTRRATTTTSLKINEPVKDPKGKKRAVLESLSDAEDSNDSPTKRQRKAYSTRSQTQTSKSTMPRKARNTGAKEKSSPMKAKIAGSSRLQDQDVEMLDATYHLSESDGEEQLSDNETPDMPKDPEDSKDDDGCSQDEDEDEGERQEDTGMQSSDGPPMPSSIDEATALGIFGDLRQFGSYMMSISSRLKTMLNNIKSTADPTTRLLTLQELSELLSISTEDTLAGSFQVEAYVRELVRILGGRGAEDDEDDDGDEDMAPQDEDSALAAALAMSTAGMYQGDENPEAQVLACRCLANLMEALPGVAHTIVYHGAIPVLCSKLIEISYIDLAEQTLSTLEKISEEFPSSIVREGGLAALLNYLDFFSIAVQRVALQAASNCCRNILPEYFQMIRGVWPIIRNCLSYADQRLVEFACLCVIRVVDSYYRNSVENLEALIDTELIHAVNQLLSPAGGSPLIAPSTYTSLLRAMAVSARASPKITVALLEANVVDTLYQILTGVLPSATDGHQEQGGAAGGQGLGGGLADMTVMENLAHRPKEQIEEALTLISELLPPLPKDGVFDHRGYTEKGLARMVKAKAKADRAAARQLLAAQSSLAIPTPIGTPSEAPSPEPMSESHQLDLIDDALPPTPSPPKEVNLDRTELLRSKTEVVGRFMQLMVPILIDVYAASVITPIRTKTLAGLMKAVGFLDADGLQQVLTFVPIASFASSILSSKDHPNLVIGALQLVELLLMKVPQLYKPAFRKEGVFHEIELLASRQLTTAKLKDKENQDSQALEVGNLPVPPQPSPGHKKPSTPMEPEDAITLRARVIQFKYLASDSEEDQSTAFDVLRGLVDRISSTEEPVISEALKQLAELFASPYTSVSSFELLQSGITDSLLQLATDPNHPLDIANRKTLIMDAFVARNVKSLAASQTPLATLVKKLQESLTRMESFEVTTIAHGIDDSKRSSPSLLARQLRLRLVADEESDIPRNLHNIVVSIHAIATFQALHDYLRPRVSGLLHGGSRLQGMLAALAASGFSGTPRPSGSSEPPSSSSTTRPPTTTGETSTSASSSSTITRRRSQRLKAKNGSDSSNSEPGPLASQAGGEATANTSTGLAGNAPAPETAPSDTVVDSELAAEFTDDEDLDAEVFEEDEVDPDRSVTEKTVTLSVAEDGSKIEAQTPDGTRVATPNSAAREAGNSISSAPRMAPSGKASYAAALKTKPTDWHLEFSMDDQVLPLDLTIYGAIHQHEARKKSASTPSMFWQGIYTVKFKKVPGPANESRDGSENGSKIRSPSPSLSSLPETSAHSKILRLLKVLHQLNLVESERPAFSKDKRNLAETAFINNKLSAKLTRQLEEPMIVASSCLPDWALDLPQHFPFIFPFATRYNFLQSTSFGYARLILRWQSQQSQSRSQDSSRRDDGIGFLGRLQRQKVRISRKHLLESAVKVFELYGSSSSILEVEYFEEVGTGLGPTLEFYSLVSKEFARRDLKIWRDTDSTHPGPYVGHPSGLYPAPLGSDEVATDGSQKRTHLLRVVGQFVAKAMLDSRIIDLHFNRIFMKLVLGEEVPLTIDMLRLVDSELANSLTKIKSIASGNAIDKLSSKVVAPAFSVEDMGLDFTVPGYDIELRPGGKDILVTRDNVDEYIREVLDAILGKGVKAQVQAFKEGFSKVFPINDLQSFSSEELVMLFGNSDEDWSRETLFETLKADHGFNIESRTIRDLVDIISSFDVSTRRAFLQFITGSPKLPIGGFRGLNPLLTVVRKPHEAPLTADDYLPSVMTCVNYLKLPEYSCKDVLREKLKVAIQEGVGSFHLS